MDSATKDVGTLKGVFPLKLFFFFKDTLYWIFLQLL